MNCLKCGKEIKDQNVFCPHCLDGMEQYPVKPDVHVQLPNRTEEPVQKKSWCNRKNRTVTEKLKHLRKVNRWLSAAVILLVLLLAITGAHLAHALLDQQQQSDIGKNYTYGTHPTLP